MYSASITTIPSIVIVSHYIAKSIILIIPVYPYSYIKGFSTSVLSLKVYPIPIHLLYSYYTVCSLAGSVVSPHMVEVVLQG